MKLFRPEDTLENIVYPIDCTINILKLRQSVDELFQIIGKPKQDFLDEVKSLGVSAINLTHLPDVTGPDRWLKYRGSHVAVRSKNVDERDFSVLASELKDLYLGEVINRVFDYHQKITGKKFQGRCQLVWLGPGRCYQFHVDKHTPDRYHIPIVSDLNCWFLFKTEELTPVYLKADGRIWYLNPLNAQHSVVHCGSIPRLHLLLTNGHHDD